MKKVFLLLALSLALGSQAQRKDYHKPKHKQDWRKMTSITVKDVTLTYDNKHKTLILTMPPSGLDTGNPDIIKSIEVYKNYLLLSKQENKRYADTLNSPWTSLKGYCSKNYHKRGWREAISPADPGEYILVVKIYYLDGSVGVNEGSLIVN